VSSSELILKELRRAPTLALRRQANQPAEENSAGQYPSQYRSLQALNMRLDGKTFG